MYRCGIWFILSLFPVLAIGAGQSINPVLDEKLSFRLGANFLNVDGSISSSLDSGPVNPNLDLDTLGIDDDYTSPYFGARWRPSERWRLTFNYFGFDNEGDISASFSDLDFGEIDVSGFVRVESQFKTDFYVIQGGYSFLKNERSELGVGLGLHIVDFDTKLKVSGQLGQYTGQIGVASTDLTAPLPNIQLFGTYAFTPKLFADGSLSYFSLDYDKYDGSLIAATVSLEYRLTKHFGVGLGYNYVNMNLDIDKSGEKNEYDLDYTGPKVFLSAGF
ncbi:MAG: hypothetical protein GY703_02540 [Gammaproteobacteria bacterium]|nr:hypothetical protein [Gammaproteobacteria bacterium]